MGRKALPLLVIGILLCSIMPISGTYGAEDFDKERLSLSISEPTFIEKGKDYISISLKEATSYLMGAGKPILPVITKTFTFPLGTKLIDVNVDVKMREYTLDKKVEPAPEPIPLDGNKIYGGIFEDEDIYNSEGFYPSNKYIVETGAGLKDGEHVLYVNVRCYTQYSPARNLLYVPKHIDIEISYDLPDKPLFSSDEYDLVIITDEKLDESAQRLAQHKESLGIKTKVVTTQYIYSNYEGRDEPEQIKLFIKDAIEKWGVKYVLLFGGRKGETLDWYVPERRSNNNADMESGYSTDLYYADIYRVDHAGNVWFEDWDWNGNGIFAEAEAPDKIIDRIDYYPDVYVGRLPIRYTWEADIIVDKIIRYEKQDDSWFKHAFVISGDTFPPARGGNQAERGIYEGEMETAVTAKYLKKAGFEVEKLWTSTGTFNSYKDVVRAFNEGPGFIHFAGHGNPAVWGNFLPDAETEEEFVMGFTIFDIWKYSNGYHLPIVVIGGCHNAQFNVSLQYLIENNSVGIKYGWYYPWDGGSLMLFEQDGGSIASIGNTGFGYGYINEYCLAGLGGWIEPRFFYNYAVQGKEYLGEVHSQTIADYISIIGRVNSDVIDRKTIEEWVLLGDPSLKVGGYGGSGILGECVKEVDGESGAFSVNAPVWSEGMEWKYKISNVDFTLDEVEGRYIDIHIKTGYLDLKVTEVTSEEYITSFSIPVADLRIKINFWMKEGKKPIVISGDVTDAELKGTIRWDRENMGLKEIKGELTGKLDLSSLPLNLSGKPPFLKFILKLIPFYFTVDFQISFNQSYQLISFPLENNKSWGLSPVKATIDGTITSKWFYVAYILDRIARIFGREIIPRDLANLLPVIEIPKLLELYEIPNEIDIPRVNDPIYHDIHLFKCIGQKQITVDAGTFEASEISMVRGIGQIFYSPEVSNVVKIQGNFHEIIPIVENIEMELVELVK